jgi:hypothetical protein
MVRLFVASVVASAAVMACTQTDNDRPASVEYITEAILQPNCGQDVCHSSYRMEKGYAFDTIAVATRSLRGIVSPCEPDQSLLYQVLTRRIKRMPYDAPLPQKDIDLILLWIQKNANEDLNLQVQCSQ